MSATAGTVAGVDVIMQRLEDQISWYSAKSRDAHRMYRRLKTIEIISAALIPFVAGLHFPYVAMVAGGLGVLVTVIEGLIHLNQYQQNWTSYRATAEGLKHEKFMYLAKAGSYSSAADPHAMLAEHVEGMVSQEGARWVASHEQEAGKK